MIKYDIAHDRGCNKVRDKCFKVCTNSVPKTCQTIKDQTAGIICANEILLRSEISPTDHRFMSHFIKTEDQYLSGARIKIRWSVRTEVWYYREIQKRLAAKKKVCDNKN